ncbi:CAP domain-containing protein [Fortiea contorta]|uniref:CAP domain-containing protein n=1 Tax=Fortiea contorta TaxID=1892405 RepID=UPI000349107B|nr:CAP domain-containing protein [Fortiea contorta]
MIKTTIYGIALGTFVLTSGANAISVADQTSTPKSSHVDIASDSLQAIPYPQGRNYPRRSPSQGTPINPQGTPINPQGTPINPQGTPINPQGTPINPQGTPINPQGTPINPQGTPINPQGTPTDPQGTPINPQGTPTDPQGTPNNPQGTPTDPQDSPTSQGTPTDSQDSPTSQGTQSSADTAAIEASVFQQINSYRASINLPALTRNSAADNQARIHSQNMASKKVAFGHSGVNQRFKATGITYKSAAENVAYNSNSDPATIAVQGWLKSPGHLANIKGKFTLTGIGVAKSSDGQVYLTQLFFLS